MQALEGRANRSSYLRAFAVVVLGAIPAVALIAFPIPDWSRVLVAIAYVVAANLLWLSASARRLHDLDRSGWWALLGYVPLVNFVLLLLFVVPGTEGNNRFGPPPIN